MKHVLAFATLVLVGAGCGAGGNGTDAPAAKRAPAQRAEDAIYIVENDPVTFDGGRAILMDAPDSAARTTFRFFNEPVAADLDGDGDMDAAVTFTKDTSGSGTFYYVSAAIKEDWGYRGTESYPLGDRISPQTLEIHDAIIVANYAERAPGEPMTTPPSVGVSRYFRIEEGQITEIPKP